MLDSLLRLIGVGGRREPEPDRLAEAQAEARRLARQQWLSLTPEERARAAEMERMLRNAEPRACSPEQLRPMTEEELARYNDPERARGVVTFLGAPIGGNPFAEPDGGWDAYMGRLEASRTQLRKAGWYD